MFRVTRRRRERGYDFAESYGSQAAAAWRQCHDGVNSRVVSAALAAFPQQSLRALRARLRVTGITCGLQAKDASVKTGVVPLGLLAPLACRALLLHAGPDAGARAG
jgi:hypothetical protein